MNLHGFLKRKTSRQNDKKAEGQKDKQKNMQSQISPRIYNFKMLNSSKVSHRIALQYFF